MRCAPAARHISCSLRSARCVLRYHYAPVALSMRTSVPTLTVIHTLQARRLHICASRAVFRILVQGELARGGGHARARHVRCPHITRASYEMEARRS